MAQTTDTNGTVTYLSTANFSRYTGATYDPANSLTPGGCIIRVAQPVIPGITTLDAGVITLSGPNGLNVTLQPFLGGYSANLPTIPQTGGSYTWDGMGGKGVGPFSSTLNLVGPLLTWTNPSAASTITQGSGLELTWTGGNPGSLVEISGASDLRSGPGVNIPVSFTCLEHVEAGRFTVPAYILDSLPLSQTAGIGITNVIYFPLSAPGVDIASGLGTIQYNRSAVITNGGGGK